MIESSKYPFDRVAEAVAKSISLRQTMSALGMTWSGGQQQNLKRWIFRYGLSTAHFLGQAHQRKQRAKNRRHWSEILVRSNGDWRQDSRALTRALLDYGRKYICAGCGQGDIWQGKKLRLQINHIDSDWNNNLPDNLEFLCPNCHSTTPGWSNRSHGSPMAGGTRLRCVTV